MPAIPTAEGRQPDIIKFTFNGTVDLDEAPDKISFATLGIGGEAVANCNVAFTGYAFKENNDGELILTVKLTVSDFSEDLSGLPLSGGDEEDDEGT